jgi:hypothetical protein
MAQLGTLIDPKKKAEILQRIKDGKAPFCAEKPAPEPILGQNGEGQAPFDATTQAQLQKKQQDITAIHDYAKLLRIPTIRESLRNANQDEFEARVMSAVCGVATAACAYLGGFSVQNLYVAGKPNGPTIALFFFGTIALVGFCGWTYDAFKRLSDRLRQRSEAKGYKKAMEALEKQSSINRSLLIPHMKNKRFVNELDKLAELGDTSAIDFLQRCGSD